MSDVTANIGTGSALAANIGTGSGLTANLKEIGGLVYSDEYQAVYDSLTTKPSNAIAAAQNTMVVALIADGVYAKFDVFYMLAQTVNTDGEALKNWINPGTYDATAYNAPVFVALEGFTGVGTSYIDCNWNPSANGVNYVKDSASIGIYIRTNVAANRKAYGCEVGTTGVFLYPVYGGANLYYKINSATQETEPNADSRGMWVLTRSANNSQDVYRNGALFDAGFGASTSIPNLDMYVLATNDDGAPALFYYIQASVFYAGADLTGTDIINSTNAIETYMDSNGKGVIA